MKKLLLAAILAALAPAANAGGQLIYACGNHAVVVYFNDRNQFTGADVDNREFYNAPEIQRRVIRGQIVTMAIAGNARYSESFSISTREDGESNATLLTRGANDKWPAKWHETCRQPGRG